MVKPPALVEFSAAQSMTLAMLGYYRWLPRATVASHQTAKPTSPQKVSLPSPQILSHPPVVNDDEKAVLSTPILKEENTFLIPLRAGASIHITYDYVVVTRDDLPCVFLLPPLWANDTGFQCFATPAERTLWLNAWEAMDIPSVSEVFQALFTANIPLQTVPNLPLQEVLKWEKRPLIRIGQIKGLEIPDEKECFDLTHPWFLTQKPLIKKTFWLELLALKEKLF